jgi:hypothetical protein
MDFLEQVSHFVAVASGVSVAAIAVAFLRDRGLVRGTRREPEDWDSLTTPPQYEPSKKPRNVDYLFADGAMVNLTFIYATLRNSEGGLFNLHEGAFLGCDPSAIKPGAVVWVSVQSGLVQEQLRVRLDPATNTLFVQSGYTRAELLARINGLKTGGSDSPVE